MIEIGEDYFQHIPISEMKLIVDEDYFVKYDFVKLDSPSIFFIMEDPIKLENGNYELTLRPVGKQTCRFKSQCYDDEMESMLAKLNYEKQESVKN